MEAWKVCEMFKTCSKCGCKWNSQSDFLADPNLKLVGYQAHFKELTTGLLMFNHSCGTTFALQVDEFSNLANGPVFTERLNGTAVCPGFCNHKENLKSCPAKCECAYVRDLLQSIQKRFERESDVTTGK